MPPTIRWEKRVIPMRRLPSGHRLTTTAWIAHGPSPRPKAYLQANVHGAEIAGNAAIFELMRRLPQLDLRGTLVLVPHVNPQGINQKVGDYVQGVYDFANGRNFNRVYQPLARRASGRRIGDSPELTVDVRAFVRKHGGLPWSRLVETYRRALGLALKRWRSQMSAGVPETAERFAYAIQSLSYDADAMLDLHTGDAATHYLYSPEYCRPSAPYFDIAHVLEMKANFGGAADEAFFCPWAWLADELVAQGYRVGELPEGYTVELGSMDRVTWKQAWEDTERLILYLRHRGVLGGTAAPRRMKRMRCALADYAIHVAPNSGLVFYEKEPGDIVHEGDVVARIVCFADLDSPTHMDDAVTEVRARADGILILRRASHVVAEGEPLFKTMTNVMGL